MSVGRNARPIVAAALALALAGCRPEAPPPLSGLPVVLCAGDSITAGGYPARLQRRLDDAGHRLQVVNAGVKGNTSGEYLAYLRSSRILERANPRWVLLQIGTNDVRIDRDATPVERFRENLEAILELVAHHRNPDGSSPRALLATIPPVTVTIRRHFNERSRARVAAEINPAILETAARRGLPLLDVHGLFARRPALLPDIHPSEEGYRALGDAWFETLEPLLGAADRAAAPVR